eukprot:Nk52_evm60s2039 gene=Nk52_evmTU60s2039
MEGDGGAVTVTSLPGRKVQKRKSKKGKRKNRGGNQNQYHHGNVFGNGGSGNQNRYHSKRKLESGENDQSSSYQNSRKKQRLEASGAFTDKEYLLSPATEPLVMSSSEAFAGVNPTDALSRSSIKELGLEKYWFQRYRLFSKFDEGILILDEEGWFSVTPELIAKHIAQRCKGKVIVDAFCGVGGNAIQFALVCEKVIAIDISIQKIQCAKNNARVYGVEDKIVFMVGDFMKIAPFLKGDCVFLSPPWGGPEYLNSPTFSIEDMPIKGKDIYLAAKRISDNIAYFVPRNALPEEMCALAKLKAPSDVEGGEEEQEEEGAACEMEENRLNGKVKACTVYYGDLVGRYVGDEDAEEEKEVEEEEEEAQGGGNEEKQ